MSGRKGTLEDGMRLLGWSFYKGRVLVPEAAQQMRSWAFDPQTCFSPLVSGAGPGLEVLEALGELEWSCRIFLLLAFRAAGILCQHLLVLQLLFILSRLMWCLLGALG